MIHCESSIERDYVRLLDFCGCVLDIIHQPLEIPYKYKGRSRRYFPDFKVVTKDGHVWIIEVKPEDNLRRPDNLVKYIVGRLYCEKMGWEYRVVTDTVIRPGYFQRNLSMIRALGNEQIKIESLNYVYRTLEKLGTCTITSLGDHCNDLSTEEFYKTVYKLIYNKKIYTDLIYEELSDFSLISVTGEK